MIPRILSFTAILAFIGLIMSCEVIEPSAADLTAGSIRSNGTLFYDTDGERMNTHGGGVLKVGEYYYWYGEHRYPNGNFLGVSCYRSRDMISWKNMGDVLTDQSSDQLNNCLIERPKVIYNQSTGYYVMWMHLEGPNWNYGPARAAVAMAKEPNGPFVYQRSFRPFDDRPDLNIRDSGAPEWGEPLPGQPGYDNLPAGYMSRDCNLFVDTDGSAYFISTFSENTRINIYRLTPDYLGIDTNFTPVVPFTGAAYGSDWQRESPCLFKRGDYYFIVTSKATGWLPNQGAYSWSTSIAGPWSAQANFGSSDTYRSQSAYVLEVKGSEGSTFVYMGDRWAPAWGGPLVDSEYVWAPIYFDASGNHISIKYAEALKVDAAKGLVEFPKYYNLTSGRNESLDLLGGAGTSSSKAGVPVVVAGPSATSLSQQWRFEKVGEHYRLYNRWSGKVLDAGLSKENGDTVAANNQLDSQKGQLWSVLDAGGGLFQLKSLSSGKLLDGNRGDNTAQLSILGTYPEIPYTWADDTAAAERTKAISGQSWTFTANSQ